MINLKQEIQNFKWTHHKLDDNFGMTLEQSKKVNDIITLAHNNAVEEMSQLFDLYLEEFEEKKLHYENKAGEACIALEKILSGRQATDISDDEIKFVSINVEAKRKQDEINYITHLQEQVREIGDRIINRVVKILEEYEVKKEPLCEQNVLLKMIKERVIRN